MLRLQGHFGVVASAGTTIDNAKGTYRILPAATGLPPQKFAGSYLPPLPRAPAGRLAFGGGT